MPVVFRGGTANDSEQKPESPPVKFGSGSDGNSGEDAQFTFHVPNKVNRTYGSKLPSRSKARLQRVEENGPPSQFTFGAHGASSMPDSSVINYNAALSIPRRMHNLSQMQTSTTAPMAERQPSVDAIRQLESKPRKKHPTCTHPNMVRLYSLTLRCDNCLNFGAFGWLYLCAQDREVLLQHLMDRKLPATTFNKIGEELTKLVKPHPRGPEERADQFAFFKEVTAEQMATYSPEQIKKILQQRENVKAVAKEDKAARRKAAAASLEGGSSKTVYLSMVSDKLETLKPWLPRLEEECGYLVCQNCRPGHADRAYLSLDGIADGYVPATAATGLGFHIFGQRPVCDATLVANLPNGCPFQPASSATTQPTSLADTQPASVPDTELTSVAVTEPDTPKTSSDATVAVDAAQISAPAPAATGIYRRRFHPFLRKTLGFPLWNLKDGRGPNDKLGFISHSPASPDLPNLTNQEHSARVSKAEKKAAAQDITTALPRLTITSPDGHVHEQPVTSMEQREMEKSQFEAKPLEVADGIAVLEESVELHVPDIMTQV